MKWRRELFKQGARKAGNFFIDDVGRIQKCLNEEFEDLSDVFVFIFVSDIDDEPLYIGMCEGGKTDKETLKSRSSDWIKPGITQETNKRNLIEIRNILHSGGAVDIWLIIPRPIVEIRNELVQRYNPKMNQNNKSDEESE